MRKFFTLSLFLMLTTFGVTQAQILAPLPAHGSVFSGNTRGYWFTSPSCFTITGLEVATQAGVGNQSIAVMRLPVAPPLFSATTNVFDVLYLVQDTFASGILPVNIQVETGDIMFIMGSRGTSNSYSTGTTETTIEGITIPIYRCGMQFQLRTVAPQDLWSQASGSISRVNMYYDSTITYNFSYNVISGTTVALSDGADSSFTSVWDYGDGSPLDTVWNPQHTYAVDGTYSVCSYITNACGTDTVCGTVVVCGVMPTANYSPAVTGLSVAFTDSSVNTTSWMWDFGDGNTDTTQNPMHTYAASGWYTVCLMTTSSCGAMDTLCDSVLVCIPPVAAWTSSNISPDTLMFTDGSTDTDSWLWDFGDGNISTMQNPSHVYATSGTYTVCLTSTGLCGSDSSCMTVNICLDPVVPGFTHAVSAGQVTFTDASTGANSYMWDFGDGNTSSLQNPTHTYATNGTFLPCLTAFNNCGDSSVTCDTVTICSPPVPSFTSNVVSLGTVDFTQTTTFPGTSSWTFGDGNVSTATDPTHTYAASGFYSVCLVVDNGCGIDSTCSTVSVNVVGIDDQANQFEVKWVPNPFEASAEIQVSGVHAPMELTLYDIQGRAVLQQRIETGNVISIARGNLPAGVYVYRLQADTGEQATGRVLAQ